MCILATATAGAKFSRSTLESMFYTNPDGAGWAYAKDGKIYYSKGYTSANKFIKAVLKLPEDVERMVHCRIATHGGVCKALTHPFPVSRDFKRMEMLSGVLPSGYILAHNGILSNFTPDKNHSDTEELVRCLANLKCDIMGEDLRDLIDVLIDGSRVAILNTDGKIKRYGRGWSYEDGIYYSNTHFKYKRTYSAYYYDDWDDWDGYYNKAYYGESTRKMPDAGTLTELDAGEIYRNTTTKKAYLNEVAGTYLKDVQTGKMYGTYKGTLYESAYEVCDAINCLLCGYDCPLKEKGGV